MVFFFKQKTAYDMRISDWSSDVCSSDLHVVPDDKVPEEVYATARRIADGAPLVHRWHKQFIRRLTEPQPLTEAEIAESYAAMGTEDYQIGVKAFLEKKKPRFTGR